MGGELAIYRKKKEKKREIHSSNSSSVWECFTGILFNIKETLFGIVESRLKAWVMPETNSSNGKNESASKVSSTSSLIMGSKIVS